MNLQNIYNLLISKAQSRKITEGYTELHHIIPLSLGGKDVANNLVTLTAKEHFVAHHLLYKIHKNREMTKAFMLMCSVKRGGVKFKITARSFQQMKEDTSQRQREFMLGKTSPAKGKKWTEESKAKLSASMKGHTRGRGNPSSFKGKHHSEESKHKISIRLKGNSNHLNMPHSEETKRMMSANRKGKTKVPWTEERKAARAELMKEIHRKRKEEKSPD